MAPSRTARPHPARVPGGGPVPGLKAGKLAAFLGIIANSHERIPYPILSSPSDGTGGSFVLFRPSYTPPKTP